MAHLDLSKLPPDFPQLFGFGYFTGVNAKNKAFEVGFTGMSLMVPVDPEMLKNPPEYGTRVIVRGILNTTIFGGRPVGTQMYVAPCPDDQWPGPDDPEVRFEGRFTLDKESWGPDDAKTYALKYKAIKFQYQTQLEQEQIDRYPTGKHTLIGQLVADTTYNKTAGVHVTLWKCIPIGIPTPKRTQKA